MKIARLLALTAGLSMLSPAATFAALPDATPRAVLFDPDAVVAVKTNDLVAYERAYDEPGFLGATIRRRVDAILKPAQYRALPPDGRAAFLRRLLDIPPTGGTTGIAFHGVPENAPYTLEPEREVTSTRFESIVKFDSSQTVVVANEPNLTDVAIDARALATLPPGLAAIVKKINIIRFVHRPGGWEGLNSGGGVITEYGSQSVGSWAPEGFRHEVGHLLEERLGLRRRWLAAIASDVLPVSGYGATNDYEDFAEFTRLYLNTRGDAASLDSVRRFYPARFAVMADAMTALHVPLEAPAGVVPPA